MGAHGRRRPLPVGGESLQRREALRRARGGVVNEGKDSQVGLAAGGAGTPGGWVLRHALRVELDVRDDKPRGADGGRAEVVGQADERQVCGGGVGVGSEGEGGWGGGDREGGVGEVCEGGDGRG